MSDDLKTTEAEKAAEYERFLSHRIYLSELAKHNITSYGKSILTISTGALGLSLIFTDRIGGFGNVKFVYLLGLAWACFIVSIMTMLLSYKMAWRDADEEVKKIDKLYQDGNFHGASANPFRERTKLLNNAAFGTLVFGVAALTTFAFLNIESVTDERQNETLSTTSSSPTTSSAPAEPAKPR